MITNAVKKIWQEFLKTQNVNNALEVLNVHGDGKYSNLVKEHFLAEYNEAVNLTIPDGYAFAKNGKVMPPNLMQNLVACKVRDNGYLGNWSGVGAGKTLSAILSSRVINSKLTVIVALNATLDGWQKEIMAAYPDSVVLHKSSFNELDKYSGHKYLILNYEKLQQKDSLDFVNSLIEAHTIDFIVLDEIQCAKQTSVISSKRRAVLQHLISNSRLKNSHMSILGISATPVINNLNEAVSLLDLITEDDLSHLKTHPTISNCLDIHKKLILHGVRYIPAYNIAIDTSIVEVNGNHLLDELQTVQSRDILKMEKVLLSAKLNSIKGMLTKGTIIYTHYVTGIVEDIKNFLSSQGFSYAEYTGDNKDGLGLFIEQKVDILIGSSTLGTGLDGLQKVCNRMILIGMPWTHSAYIQLLGRIYRQGSFYNKVDVIIPHVILKHSGGEWSYDKYRWDKILFKKTLGDAVLDGYFPDDKILSPNVMFDQAIKALHSWIGLLEAVTEEA